MSTMAATTSMSEQNGPAVRAALVYLYAAFILFLGLGVLGLAMRLAHAQWIPMDPAIYDEFFTVHGAGMVAAVLLGAEPAVPVTRVWQHARERAWRGVAVRGDRSAAAA